MDTFPLPHLKEKNSGTGHGKIAKSILLSIALFFALSPSVLAHDFDFTNPEQLQIELSDALLVRPPPMTNIEKNVMQTQTTLAVPTPQINLINFLGILLTFAGFIIGLGAVTVIDLHGFLARKSKYWTEATIRTHKITKPLIWIGMFLAIVGETILYRSTTLTQAITVQIIIAVILILNGCFLTFKISPFLLNLEKQKKETKLLPQKLQSKIFISFLISFFGWWAEVALFCIALATRP